MHRLGPGRRAKHLEVQALRVQQLAKVGLISLNKLKTKGNVADLLTKQVPRGSTRQVGWNDGLHSLVKEVQSFLRTQASTKITGSESWW